jgi:hypothetical protein
MPNPAKREMKEENSIDNTVSDAPMRNRESETIPIVALAFMVYLGSTNPPKQ